MKTGIIKNSNRGHNVLAVTTDGRPISTQVWEGGVKAAAKWALRCHAEGQDETNKHRDPIAFVFINSHSTKETYVYNLENGGDLLALQIMSVNSSENLEKFCS